MTTNVSDSLVQEEFSPQQPQNEPTTTNPCSRSTENACNGNYNENDSHRVLRRCQSAPCLDQEEDPAAIAARMALCTACLRALPSSSAQTRSTAPKSALASSSRHEQQSSDSQQQPSSPRGVQFGTVHVHEHAALLGCHPDVRQGPPTTLSWCPVRSTATTVDTHAAAQEEQHKDSSARLQYMKLRTPSAQRTQLLLETGLYTSQDLAQVQANVHEIQTSRQHSAADPISDWRQLAAEYKAQKQEKALQQQRQRKRRGLRRLFSV